MAANYNSHPEGVNANSYVLTGLNNNTPYTLKLRAVDVNGVNGPVSAEVTGTPFVPSVNISTDALTIDEGSTGDYTVVLGSQPTGDVTITPTSGDAGIATLTPASLTFTDTNWDTPQTITVTGVNDDKDNGTHRDVTITHRATGGGYDGVLIADVDVHVTDDDTAGVDVTETGGDTQVSERGTQDTFSVVLTSEPDADVVIGISSSDTGEATVGPATLTFTDTNWDRPQTITVTGINDDIADGVQAIEINLANAVSTDVDYGGKFSSHVDVSVADDDNTGIRLSNALLRVDEGSTGDYTVVLGSQPTGDVTITPTSGDADIATLTPASLTFTDTNWDTPQTITVTGVNDDKDNGTHRDVTITHRAVGGGYDGVLIADVDVHVTDDDTAGVDVTETGGDTQVSETGTQDTFSVVLTSEPDADVVIGISSSDTGEATVGPASLTFTDTNWDRPQIVTVTGVNDDIADGVQAIEINLANAVSTDGDYGGKFSSHVDVSVADDDNTGIRLSSASLRVDEGSTGDYTVVLGSQPTGDVTITPTSGDAGIATLTPASLTFTDTNWDTPQTITVTGVNDDKDNGTHRDVTITHRAVGGGYDGVLIADVDVHVTDDDTAGVDVTETGGDTQVSEGGTQDTFSVVLTSEPDADVVIGISSSDTGEATVGPATLTFTDTNWDRPQIVTVTGVNDDIADGVQAIEINLANAVSTDVDYGGKFSSHVDVSVADDDNTGIRLSRALLTVDEGSTGDYTVVLGSQPTGDVTITPTSGDADIATLTPASLTFTDTNWDTPQTITVTGVNDDKDNGTHRDVTITHRATGGGYDGVLIADVDVHVTDDDTAGVDVTETGGDTQVSEGGTQDTFSVVLTSEPDADVVIGISSSDTGEATVGPATLTFTDTNWDRPQTITVTGINDDIADGVQAIEINLANAVSTDVDYGGKFSSHVDVSVADDDNTGIRLSNALLRVDEGSTGDYTVVLGSQPTGDVTITPTSGDADIATLTPASLTFTDTNWDTPQTITVTGVNDDKDNGTHRDVTITHRATGGGYDGVLIADVGVHVTDDDTAGVDVTETGGDTQVSETGTQDTFSVVLTSEPDADVVIGISSSDTGEATVGPASLTFTDTNWDRPQIVTVTGVNDDIADGVQAIEINLANAVSTDGDYGGKFSSHVDVSVADDDNTGIRLSSASLRVDEGSTGDYTVVLGSQPTGDVTITPTSGDAGIATLTPASLTFTDTNWDTPQTITVTGVNDDKDNGTHRDVTITHRATGGGYDGVLIADVGVHVTDDDTAGVDVTETGGDTQVSETGTQDTFTVLLSSQPTADVVIGISSSDAGEATVLPATLTFTDTNWDRPQTITVTGVNDDIADGVQAIEINLANAVSTDGDYGGKFSSHVDVSVADDDNTGIRLSRALLTVDEGSTGDYTVVLGSQPTADVVIGISSSDAGEATVLPATLTFTVGNWHVAQSVTVTGQDDDVADGDQQVDISLANAVSTDGDYNGQFGQTITVTVTDNDAPGITVLQTDGDTTVSETGTQDTFSVVLTSEPDANVSIAVSSSDAGEATVLPATLTFTDTNWHVAQSVTVTGQDDDVADGDQQVDISLANAVSTDGDYNGQFGQTITVTVTDNDAPGITILQTDGDTTVSERGTQDTFSVVLTSEPDANVSIAVSSSDAGEATVLPATLTFTDTNWHVAQSVTVTGQDDDVADGDQQVDISLANAVSTDGDYNGQFGQTITVTVTDNDAPGITILQTDGDTTVSERGTQDTFSVVLTSEPDANVSIAVSSSDAGEATVLPATLTFTVGNWHVAQSVTVTGQDDDVADGDQQVDISLANAVSTDGDYNGQFGQTITVTVTDNDAPGITILQTDGDTTVSETGTQDTFSVVLTSEPDANVSIAVSSSDAGEATVLPATLTFTDTNWHVAQSVTVTGQDDDVADGDQQVDISLANAVSTDGDYNGQFGQTITVTVTDNDAPGITILQTDGDTTVSERGTQDTFTVLLSSQPTADVVIGISSSDAGEATVLPATLTFTDTNWHVAQSVTVTGQDDDVADGDQQVDISLANAVSTDGDYNGQFGQTITVTVTDNDAPGITILQTDGDTTVSERGTQDTFSVVLTSEPDANVSIAVSSSDAGEATVLPATLTFTVGNWHVAQSVTVTGQDDDVADGDQQVDISLANAVSTDGDYNGQFGQTITVTVTDNDAPGITILQTDGDTTVSETGTQDTFSVVLTSEPDANVSIAVSSSDAGEATVLPATLTFTDTNWHVAQSVTVTGQDDDVADGDQQVDISLANAVSTDGDYNGQFGQTITVTVTDNDAPGITILQTDGDTTVSERGTQDTFSVVLTSEPDANVSIAVSNSDAGEATVLPATLTFTVGNWHVAQSVTVTGQDDDVADGDQQVDISLANAVSTDGDYNGQFGQTITVTVTDNDAPGITILQTDGDTTVSETGTQDTFTVLLSSQPTADVVIGISSSDAGEATVLPATLTFTDTNWHVAQSVTVTGQDDDVADGDQQVDISLANAVSTDGDYNGQFGQTITVTVTDNDAPGITILQTDGDTTVSERGTQDTFSVVLTSEPDANVSIAVSSSDAGEATVLPATLTFTVGNWHVAQSVTVTGQDDDVADGDQQVDISLANAVSTDGDYNGQFGQTITVTVTDNDAPGITILQTDGDTTVSETGTQDTFTVLLSSQPTADVVIGISSSDAGEATVLPATLTFTDTNWHVAQSVTVTGQDDDVADGDQQVDISLANAVSTDGDYNGQFGQTITVTVTDNDAPGITILQTDGDTTVSETGTQDTFSVVLTSEPDANVSIAVSSSDAGEATVLPATLTFTVGNWHVAQSVTVTGQDDDVADGDQQVDISLANAVSTDGDYNGQFGQTITVTVTDNDAPGITILQTDGDTTVSETGTQDTFTVLLSSQPTADVVIGISSSDAGEATVLPATLTFTDTNWHVAQSVTVTGQDDDVADGDQQVDISLANAVSTDGDYNGQFGQTITVTVTDNDAPGITILQTDGDTTVSERGTQDTFSVVLTSEPDANVSIAVSSSDAGEATVLPATLTFTVGNWHVAQSVTVTGQDDDVADGDQQVDISLANAVSTDGDYNGQFGQTITVTVTDNDAPGITVLQTDGDTTVSETGTQDTFTVLLSSQPTADVVIGISSSDAGEATVLPATLTFTDTNWHVAQSVTVTGQDDDVADGDQQVDISLANAVSTDGDYNGQFGQTITVTVTDNDAPGITILQTDGDTTVSERGTQDTFSVVLTSEPDANVSIAVSSSDAGEATVLPATLTFTDTNWHVAQSVTVTGQDDDVADGDQQVDISLANAVSTDGDYNGQFGQTITVTVTDNDAPGITILQTDGDTTVSERGTQDTFSVVLTSEPDANVSIAVSSSDAGEATVLPATLTFTVGNWHVAQSVTVTGQDDDVADGDQQVDISLANAVSTDGDYNGQFGQTITVTVTDNDAPGITILQTDGDTTVSETGTQDTFTVLLSSQPTADVVIGISSSDAGEATVLPATLTFTDTNWHVAQSVTVTGQDDDVADGDQQVDISLANAVSTDGDYNGQFGQTITVTVTDNDAPGITILQTDGDTTVSERGTQDTFSVVLTSEPDANVSIAVSSSDAGEATVLPATLTFTVGNWHVAQSVTVTGQDDDVADGDQQVDISLANAVSTDGDYNGQFGQTITVTVTDNDAPGITILQTDGDTTVSETGTQDTFSVVLTSEPDANVSIAVSSSDAGEATVLPATLTFTVGNWHVAQSVTVTGQDDDVADGDQQVDISLANAVSTDGDYNGQFGQTITVTVTDNDAPGITILQTDGDTTVSERGTQDTFSVVLTSEPDANVSIAVSSSDAGEATVLPATLTFTVGNWHVAQSVTVTGQDDDVADGDQQVDISLANAVSTDGDYNGQFGQTITVTVTDNDAPGITILQTDGDTTVSETGTQDTFTVLLSSQPTADVVIGISSSDAGEATVLPATLTFTDTNWHVAQSVTVTGQDDDVADGDQQVDISLANAVSTDGDYNGQFGQTITVTVTDNDAPGITILQTDGDTTVSERGTQDTFSVVLTSEPDANVSIAVSSSDAGEATVLPATLTFTVGNWHVAQSVTVTGQDDDVADGDQQVDISLANAVSTDGDYNGQFGQTITVTVTDNDAPGITILQTDGDTTVSETGTQDTFTVLLSSQPTADVVIGISSSDAGEATVLPATLTFTDTNWHVAQSVTVTGQDDDVADGDQQVDISLANAVSTDGDYNGQFGQTITVTVTDNDAPGITILQTDGDTTVSETGTQDTFSVVLTSEPDANVSIAVSSSDAGEATVLPATLTFTDTNWHVAQSVTVTGQDDDVADGDQQVDISLANAVSTDGDYNGQFGQTITVTVTDNDAPGITILQTDGDTTVSETGTQDTFSVVLTSEPDANVSIAVSSSDAGEATVLPATLTFTDTNWHVAQSVTVTGQDDDVADGDQQVDISLANAVSTDGDYNGQFGQTITVTVTDNDAPGITILQTDGDTTVSERGTQDTFSVVLTSEPDANVSIAVSSSDAGEATVLPATLTFTVGNWHVAQSVTVTGQDDDVADGDQQVDISLANAVSTDGDYNGQFGQTITVTVTDNDAPGITILQTDGDTTVSERGTQDTFSVVLTSEPDANVSIAVSSSDAGEATVLPATLTFTDTNWHVAQSVTVTGQDDDVADGDQQVDISLANAVSTDGDYNGQFGQTITVTVTDNDAPGITILQTDGDTTVSERGTQDTFSVVLTSEPDANVSIAVSSSDAGEATVLPATLTFTVGNWHVAQSVTVTGQDDDVADGDQQVDISLANAVSTDGDYNGQFGQTITVTVTDNDAPGITILQTDGDTTVSETGTQDTFSVVLTSEPDANVSIAVSSSDAGEATVLPATLTFTDTNWHVAQSVTVTGQDDDVADGDQQVDISLANAVSTDGDYNGQFGQTITVTVTDNDAPGITILQTDGDTTVSETGTQDTFSVVLTSEPDANVSIAVSSSDAGEATVLPATLTFTDTNWHVAQSVTVTGQDDDVADGDQQVDISLANAVSTDGDYNGQFGQTITVTVTDNDAPGITILQTDGDTTVSERGTQDTFSVVLTSEPDANVSIAVSSSDAGEATVLPATLTFTVGNWHVAQSVTVTGQDDDVADGDQQVDISLANAVSTDGDYNGQFGQTITVTVTDNDAPGITILQTDGDTTVSERGTQDTFSVVLTSEPDANVSIAVSSSDAGEATVLPATLTFTDTNWHVAQSVTVTGQDDDVADGDQQVDISLANAVSTDGDYNGQFGQTITVTVTDNDAPGITILQTDGDTTVSERGTQDTFSVVLTSEPDANVSIAVSSSDAGEATVLPATLTFTVGNWHVAQSVTVTGQDDDVADGDQQVDISLANAVSTDGDYNGQFGQTITVTVTDNDAPGITILQTDGDTTVSETGTQDTFSVVLTSEPDANVSIAVSSSDAGEATVLPATLTFTDTNWHVAQSVTVTGQDDDVADGDQQVDISLANAVSTDGDYNGQFGQTITVTVTDNDAPGITILQTDGDTTVSETGTQDTFTVLLSSQPTADVVIGISSSDAGEATVLPATLTFTDTNWHVAQSVTVTGQDDDVADGDQQVDISLANAVSTDGDYNGQFGQTITVTVTDNDAPGITILQTDGDTTVSETGTQDTFTVLLSSQPTADVVIGISSSDAGEATVLPATLTFTDTNWDRPQTITVTGVNDDIADGVQAIEINLANAVSTDGDYGGKFSSHVDVSVADDDNTGIRLSRALLTVDEGSTGDYTVVLGSQPTADVVIGISSSDAGEATVLPATLTFTVGNWHVAQSVTVTGQDDDVADGDQQVDISLANAVSTDGDYNGQFGQTITVTVTDNDAPGITVLQTDGDTTVSETGTQDTFSVVLTSEPDANVSIAVSSSDAGEATVLPATLTFTDTNWHVAQSVTVTGQDDDVADGDQQVDISLANAVSTDGDYNGQFGQTITVTVTDNDAPGITILQTDGDTTVSERGTQDTFSVVLTSEPDANVSIAVSSSDAGEATVLPATLTFTDTNWHVAQSVTVTGQDDDVADGDQQVDISLANAVSTDGDYNGQFGQTITVTVTDNDAPGITILQTDGDTTVSERGTQDTFSVVLTSEPDANVSIAVSSSDAGEATVLPATLTFTVGNWHVAQSVTVTGQDDDVADGDQQVDISLANAVSTDGDYNGQFGQTITVTVTDNDAPGITILQTDGDTTVSETGTQDTFSVVLTSEPDANVSIAVSSSDAGEATVLPATLTFTDTNWHVAQSVTVTGQDDDVADGDQQVDISLANAVSTDGDYNGQFGQTITVTVTDNDAPGITILQTDGDTTVSERGTQDTFSVVLTSEPDANVSIAVSSSDAGEATVLPATLTFTDTNWHVAQSVTVTGQDDDVADGDQQVDISLANAVSTDGDYNGQFGQTITVTVTDNDAPGITILQTDGDTTVSETGTQDTFTVLLSSQPTADVVIGISSSDAGEATVLPATLTFTDTNWHVAQSVTVTGQDDDVADGDQQVDISLANAVSTDGDYNGQFGQTITVTVTDNDAPGITILQTDGDTTVSERGTQDTFSVVLTSEPDANVSIAVSSSDAGEATVLPATLTFTVGNWHVAQSVTVTGQDDDVADGDQQVDISLANAVSTDGDYNGQFGQTITVTVTDNDAPGITILQTDGDTTVSERGTQDTFSVVLTSEPDANVSIAVSSSDAGEATVLPATLTFTDTNWHVAQSVTVTGQDDDVADGDQQVDISLANAVSTDGDYNGQFGERIAIEVIDDDTATRDMSRIDKAIAPQMIKAMAGMVKSAVLNRMDEISASSAQPQRLNLNGQNAFLPWLQSNQQALQEGTVSWRQQLLNSGFSISLAELAKLGNPDTPAHDISHDVSLWGNGAYEQLSNTKRDDVQWDGEIVSAIIGIDKRHDNGLLLGASLNWSKATIDYMDTNGDMNQAGDYESTLTSIHPYVNWKMANNSHLWMIGGYGEGEITVTESGKKRNSDSRLVQFSIGGDMELLSQSDNPSDSLRVKLQTSVNQFDVHGYREELIEGLTYVTYQTRLSLEAKHTFMLYNGNTLMPSLEFGLRDDSGDGQTGHGSEMVIGMRYNDAVTGSRTKLQWRRLLTHSSGLEEWGVSGLLTLQARNRLGLSLEMQSAYGDTENTLLVDDIAASPVNPVIDNQVQKQDYQLNHQMTLGYGLATMNGRALLTPYTKMQFTGSERNYRFGARWQHKTGIDWGIVGGHHAQKDKPANNSIEIDLRLQW